MNLIQAAEKLRTLALDCGGDMSSEGLKHLTLELEAPSAVVAQHQWRGYTGDIRALQDGTFYWIKTKLLGKPVLGQYVSPSDSLLCFDGRRRIRVGLSQIAYFTLAVVPEPPVSERAAAIERLRTAVGGSIALQADIDTLLGDVL